MKEPIILSAESITKSYPAHSGKGRLLVLNEISLEIPAGAILGVVGPSGSGKSTMLHVLGGLEHPDSGRVRYGEQDIYSLKTDRLAEFRNSELGFVFQFHHLLPEFTAVENVMMPALIRETHPKEARNRAESLLDRFGILPRAEHRPAELSGGEQQRVSLARALMNQPKLILADEPTGNLDERNTQIVLDLLFELREKDRVSILLITHEKEIANRCDRVYELDKSKLEQTA
jgi:lipoprotein-releasing system ATP-binding protein